MVWAFNHFCIIEILLFLLLLIAFLLYIDPINHFNLRKYNIYWYILIVIDTNFEFKWADATGEFDTNNAKVQIKLFLYRKFLVSGQPLSIPSTWSASSSGPRAGFVYKKAAPFPNPKRQHYTTICHVYFCKCYYIYIYIYISGIDMDSSGFLFSFSD